MEVYKRPNVKPITYSVQERNVRLNILPRWGNYRLKDLSRSEYQKWINELRGKYSEGTVRRIHSIMGSAISDAVHEFRILRESPLQRIKIPKEVEKTGEVQCFSVPQLNQFLQALMVPHKNAKYQHSRQYFALSTLLAVCGSGRHWL